MITLKFKFSKEEIDLIVEDIIKSAPGMKNIDPNVRNWNIFTWFIEIFDSFKQEKLPLM